MFASFKSLTTALAIALPAILASAMSAPAQDEAGFVGSEVCADCHQGEAELWRGSHHAHAMLEADSESVLAPFDGETFSKDGVTTTFFQRDGKYVVNTDGPDGELQDFEIDYTFGVTPLQQYLIALPGGRYQALGIAWDSRPEAEGGQRWFHLYPDMKLSAGDPIHWTGIDQNWNYQCAWCHSTNLEKNYDPETDLFSTTWSEINVGCEACHGPGKDHLLWLETAEDDRPPMSQGAGFALRFDEREDVFWEPGDAGTALRSTPRTTMKEINLCAGCHARRGQFSDDPHHAAEFLSAFRPSLLSPGLYYSDGQQLDEVYKYGSFLQSKMHAEGVTCSDCHEPHSGKLLLEGNALCGQCHEPEVFDTAEHHHHTPETEGAQCASCHMPTTNYMIVDARHDHSLRIPRPDLTISTGAPNACNHCHETQNAQWAVDRLVEWFGEPARGHQDFAELFHASDRGAPGSREALIAWLDAAEKPPIVTASALARIAANPTPEAVRLAREKLSDSDPIVRSAAIPTVGRADTMTALNTLSPLLDDESMLVRMDAARAMVGEPEAMMSEATREKFESALAEYIDGQLFNAERPEANANLALLNMEQGNLAEAERYYETALKRDPTFAPAAIGLVELYRARGDEQAAESLLREMLEANADSADLAHALGLVLVRQRNIPEAMSWLRRAAERAVDNPRYAYVYAVALHDSGNAQGAIAQLTRALQRHPYDQAILEALISYELQAGNLRSALARLETLDRLQPNDPQIQQLIMQLRQRLQ